MSAHIMLTNGELSSDSKTSIVVLKNGANVQEWSTKKKEHGMTGCLLMTCVAVLMCSAVPTGYNIGVLNPPQAILQAFCNETIFNTYGVAVSSSAIGLIWSAVISIYLIGCMIGSLSAGWLCNTFGRKKAIIHVSWFGLTSAILFSSCKFVPSIEMIFAGRILVGVFSGFSLSALPIYLAELSPARLKGALGVLQPLGMTFGLVIALTLGLDGLLGNEDCWPYLLGLYGAPVVAFTGLLLFCPESPKYLLRRNSELAIKELCRVRNAVEEELEDEIFEMTQDMRQELSSGTAWSFLKVITSPDSRFNVLLLCILHIAQQLSGIGAVFYYSTAIFSSAGMSNEQSQYASIGAGLVNFLMAAIATWLVSRFRRRPLLFSSMASIIVCLVGLTVSFHYMETVEYAAYLSVVFLLLFVLTMGSGLGPIPFFIGNELIPAGPRPIAMSIGCTCNAICNFLVGLTFPTLQSFAGEFSFLIFVCITVAAFIFLYTYLPETKGKDLENQGIQDSGTQVVLQHLDESLAPINECCRGEKV